MDTLLLLVVAFVAGIYVCDAWRRFCARGDAELDRHVAAALDLTAEDGPVPFQLTRAGWEVDR